MRSTLQVPDVCALRENPPHRRFLALIVALVSMVTVGLQAQTHFSGQASTALVKSDDRPSQYSYNGGQGTFNWRLDLFGDVLVSEHIIFRSSLRMYENRVPYIDLFSLSFANVTALDLTIDAGEIDLPVGNLGERRYPMKNPFLSLPLMNEHHTTVRYPDYQLWPFDARYTVISNGLRLLDRGLYDLGVKVTKSLGMAEFAVAVINGTVSSSSVYANEGTNTDSRFGAIVHVAVTPVTGLSLGGSYADGRIPQPPASGAGQLGYGGDVFRQHLFEADVEYSFDHFAFYGQVIDNVWELNRGGVNDLNAVGYSLEGTCTLVPRLSFGARAGGILFNSVNGLIANDDSTAYYSGLWDHNVTRLELTVGYRIAREAILKFMFQWNSTAGLLPESVERIFAVQTVVAF